MDKRLEIIQAKELRGDIVRHLYDFYGEDTALSTIKKLLRYKSYYTEKDIRKAFCYLSGGNKGYIRVSVNAEEWWDSLVQLTPAGVNLAEKDIEDAGVILNE